MSLLAQFTLKLLAGIALLLCVMPGEKVASGFFRVQMLVILGLSVLLSMTTLHSPVMPISLAVAAFVGSALWMLERRRPARFLLIAIAAAALGELVVVGFQQVTVEPKLLCLASEMAASATLGAAMTGMLLGHRYLTAPGMPLRPLEVLNTGLAIAGVARLAVSAVALWQFGSEVVGSTPWTWLGLRWLAGVGGPLLAAVLVWRILKHRNTQAATGVLFTAVILTFIGELSADLLALQTRRPF